jgi:hypothetical protein
MPRGRRPSEPPEGPRAARRPRTTAYTDGYPDQARKLCALGATDEDLAEFFRVSRSTIGAWKTHHPEFGEALRAGKSDADDRVEKSLYQCAVGYSHPDVHVSHYQGAVTITPLTKHHPPNVTACIFWLKNRRKDTWREKVDHEVTGRNGGPIQTEDARARELLLSRIAGIAERRGTQRGNGGAE